MEVEKTKSKFNEGDVVLFLTLTGINRGKVMRVNPLINRHYQEPKFYISFKYEVQGSDEGGVFIKEIAEEFLFRDYTEVHNYLFKQ